MDCRKGRTRRKLKKPTRRARRPIANLDTLRERMEASGAQLDPPHWQEASENRFDRR